MLDAHYDHFIVLLDVDENEPFAVVREIIEGAMTTVDRELMADERTWAIVSNDVVTIGSRLYLLVLAKTVA